MIHSCFLFGHRDAPESILPALEAAIESHYEALGIRRFIVGHYGNFDHLAARALRSVKRRHPDMELLLLLPYHPSTHPATLPDGFDDTLYPDGMEHTPYRLAIVQANRRMVQQCAALICWVCHPGNTRELLEYAQKRKIASAICNLSAR